MSLRRAAVPAIVLALLGSMVPAAEAIPTADRKVATKELPRPERSRAVKDTVHEPHSVLVEFTPGASASDRARVLKSRGARSLGAIPGTGFTKVRTKGAARDAARELRKDSKVKTVALDYRRAASAVPDDVFFRRGDQDYLKTIRMPEAWDRTKGSTSQVIAIVDSGVDGSHPELYGRTLGGYNAITNAVTPANASSDDNGHGTMVAGIAAAKTNNVSGIAGVAWAGGRVLPVKVLDAGGQGWDSDVAEGITWAADHGARVINLSLGGSKDNPALRQAITYATGKGAVVVVAAGNEGDNTPQYPAAYPEVLAVGATDKMGRLTDFSSHGDWIDVAAPGFDIVSTGPGGSYYGGSGTSFAAPIVAGVAALVRSAYPTLTPAQVSARIKATARDAGPRGIDPYYGRGVLDAAYAVGGTKSTDFPVPVLGTGEPNNVPAGATLLTGTASGTIAMEGDVDWYRYESTATKSVSVTVKPPAFSTSLAQNVDPVLSVYDKGLRLVGEVDSPEPGAAESFTLTLATGTHYIKVRSWNGAADLRPYTVTIGAAPAPLFDPARSTSVGSWAETVAVGDVTGEGREDVLLRTATNPYAPPTENDHTLFVFPQLSNGSLGSPTAYPIEGQAQAIELVDVNADGRQDVVTPTSTGLDVFLQTQAGTLVASDLMPDTGSVDRFVAADMDGDADIDFVVAGYLSMTLLTRGPDGAYTTSVLAPDNTYDLEVGDVDGDGSIDVVGIVNNTIRVYHHTGNGWNRTEHTAGSAEGMGIDVADVSGDGRADIIATASHYSPNSYIVVMTQNATGGLNPPVLHSVPDLPEPLEAADMDGDGRTDVVVAHADRGILSVLPQKADGTLGAPITSRFPYTSQYHLQGGLALGDINGDQQMDAVLAGNTNGLVVLRNASGPTPGGEQVWVRGISPGENASAQAPGIAPKVTFQRALAPASVTASTVRLVNGKTGATVAATVAYDSVTRAVTIKPTTSLPVNTPFRIVVKGVRDASGATQAEAYTSTFRTGWYRITARLPR